MKLVLLAIQIYNIIPYICMPMVKCTKYRIQTTNNETLTVDNRNMLLMIHVSLNMYVHIPSHSTRANILSCYLKYILTVEQVLFKLLYTLQTIHK